jgi:hypothetical protein
MPTKAEAGVPRTQLDRFAPVYEFNEVHSIRIAASPRRAYEAIKSVTADEIFLFRAMVWIRRFGRSGPESILNPSKNVPVLEVATRTTFLMLADQPDREIVIGMPVLVPRGFALHNQVQPEAFATIRDPGFALGTLNFLIDGDGPDACRVTTETRVHATDAATQRWFANYWRVVYPGSAFIRRMWLRAIKRRAEGGARTKL